MESLAGSGERGCVASERAERTGMEAMESIEGMSGALDGAGVAGTVAVPSPVAWACRAGGSRSATKWRAWETRTGGGRPRRRGPAESGAEAGWTAPAARAGAGEAGAVGLPSPGGRVEESRPGRESRRG